MFNKRIKELRKKILKEKLDGVLISSISNITFLTGYANFSGEEREAYLLIGKDFQYIITDGRYSEAIKRQVVHFNLFERNHENKLESLLKSLKNRINVLAVEEDDLTVLEHKFFKKHFKKLKSISLHTHRSIKSTEEITKIKKACQLGDQAFEHILKKIKVGISEKSLAWEIEKFIKDQGAQISFPSIVAFGKNSSIPHHHTGNDILGSESSSGQEGLIILLDLGVKFENYCSDMTRTVFFGKPSNKQKEIYETVLEAQKRAVSFANSKIKSGEAVKASEIDKIAREEIISKGFPTIPHSLGHGIGLEVHERPSLSPKSKDQLKLGMVFSIEPGIYIPDFGSPRSRFGEAGGVRIEDLYVYGKKGLSQLTNSSKKLLIIP